MQVGVTDKRRVMIVFKLYQTVGRNALQPSSPRPEFSTSPSGDLYPGKEEY
jgi:hypothetical protein